MATWSNCDIQALDHALQALANSTGKARAVRWPNGTIAAAFPPVAIAPVAQPTACDACSGLGGPHECGPSDWAAPVEQHDESCRSSKYRTCGAHGVSCDNCGSLVYSTRDMAEVVLVLCADCNGGQQVPA